MATYRNTNHLSGGKYTARHTTVTEAASLPVQMASALTCVHKISLGLIKSLRNGQTAIKFSDAGPTCLLVKVRGNRSIQEVRIYTSNKEQVKEVMIEGFKV